MLKRALLVICLLSLWTLTLTACGPAPSPEASPTAPPLALPTVLPTATATVGPVSHPTSTVFVPQTTTEQPGQSSTATISFIIIAQEAPLGDYPAEPFYTVIGRSGKWDELREVLPDRAIEAGIQASSSKDDLIVVAFAGVKGSSGYNVTVESIVQAGDQLVIVVSQTVPGSDDIVEPATTLPYHLVAVPMKSLDLARVRTFIFHDVQGTILNQGDISFP
jgi:hypothetical protein